MPCSSVIHGRLMMVINTGQEINNSASLSQHHHSMGHFGKVMTCLFLLHTQDSIHVALRERRKQHRGVGFHGWSRITFREMWWCWQVLCCTAGEWKKSITHVHLQDSWFSVGDDNGSCWLLDEINPQGGPQTPCTINDSSLRPKLF